MPILVIHQLGRPPRREAPTTTHVRVGRDVKNDVVLAGATVSRAHLTLTGDPRGEWSATCLSSKNPIVVDGTLVTGHARVGEGSEILVGKEHLIVFAQSGVKAQEYMGATITFAKSTCQGCGYSGVVSTLRREPVCPRCGGTRFVADSGQRPKHEDSTQEVGEVEAQVEFLRLRNAKRTALERVDKGDHGSERVDLAEDRVVKLGGDGATFELRGLAVGSVKVSWDGMAFLAESAMKFPAMRVNGQKCDSKRLRHGDLVEIGSNRFRVVVR
jgi:pSer/pThr/pTyr-binding forkhead associated (FHA) protein